MGSRPRISIEHVFPRDRVPTSAVGHGQHEIASGASIVIACVEAKIGGNERVNRKRTPLFEVVAMQVAATMTLSRSICCTRISGPRSRETDEEAVGDPAFRADPVPKIPRRLRTFPSSRDGPSPLRNASRSSKKFVRNS